ncbi:hypothetical protein ACOMHN_012177 [Nucella lapillus]
MRFVVWPDVGESSGGYRAPTGGGRTDGRTGHWARCPDQFPWPSQACHELSNKTVQSLRVIFCHCNYPWLFLIGIYSLCHELRSRGPTAVVGMEYLLKLQRMTTMLDTGGSLCQMPLHRLLARFQVFPSLQLNSRGSVFNCVKEGSYVDLACSFIPEACRRGFTSVLKSTVHRS